MYMRPLANCIVISYPVCGLSNVRVGGLLSFIDVVKNAKQLTTNRMCITICTNAKSPMHRRERACNVKLTVIINVL